MGVRPTASAGLVVIGALLLTAVALGVPRTLPREVAAPVAWALLPAAAPAVVWGLAGGLSAGAAAFLAGSAGSLLALLAAQHAGLEPTSVAAGIALVVAVLFAAPVLASYAGGAAMACRTAGGTSLRRGFVAGALAELARPLAGFVLDAAWRPAAWAGMLFGLPLLLAFAPIVGLAGAAGAWLGSPTRPGRRRAVVGWSGSLLVSLTVVWIASSLLPPILLGRAGLAPGVTRDGIRAVRAGMTREEIEAILGPPVSAAPTGYYHEGGVTLTYARPVPFARWYPMLWVHLHEGRVISVYAKRYIAWGMDDLGVYVRDGAQRWERAEFEATFPR
jgi:hypothetical protein